MIATIGKGWTIDLVGTAGAQSIEIGGFEETDLYNISDEGYITLIPKKHGYSGSLKPKAYDQYKRYKQQSNGTAEAPADSQTPSASRGEDASRLGRIETSSQELLLDLRKNYDLSRTQAGMWFRWTLTVSVFGFILLGASLVLGLSGQTDIAIANTVAGVITEFIALVFFKQANAANNRQDQYHRDALGRQQILDAVQFARLMSGSGDRDRITESIIRQLMGFRDDDPSGD